MVHQIHKVCQPFSMMKDNCGESIQMEHSIGGIQLTTFGNVGEFDGRMDALCPSCFVRVHRSLVA